MPPKKGPKGKLKEFEIPDELKWAKYYEAYGCVVCEKKEPVHAANGFCMGCYTVVQGRLFRVLRTLSIVLYGKAAAASLVSPK